jgi:hypothetical protein
MIYTTDAIESLHMHCARWLKPEAQQPIEGFAHRFFIIHDGDERPLFPH